MKSFFASAFVAVATATSCSDFPKDSWNHSGCHMNVTFSEMGCNDLYQLISAEIGSWAEGDPCTASGFPGFYSVKYEETDLCIWSTRLTANKKYTDDQLFDFAPSGDSSCFVKAKSRSESVSMLDNCVNYCNMWNVFEALGTPFTVDKVSHCSQTPSDAATTCARY